MAECGECGSPLAEDARFCARCGTPVAAAPRPEPVLETAGGGLPGAPTAAPAPAGPFDVAGPTEGATPRSAPSVRQRLATWGIDAEAVRTLPGDTVRALAPQLAFLTVVAAIAALALQTAGHRGNPVDWARTGVYLAGTAVRGGLTVESSFLFGVGQQVVWFAMPLLATLSGLLAVGYVAARREEAEPSGTPRVVAGRAVLTGAAYGIALAILAVVSRGGAPYGYDDVGTVRLRVGSVLVGSLLLVSAAAAAGRARVAVRRAGGTGLRDALLDRAGGYAGAVRTATTTLALTTVAAFGYVVVDVLVTGEGVTGRLRALLTTLLLAPNFALGYGGVAMGATIGLSGTVGATGEGAADGFGFGASGGIGYGFVAGGMPLRYWALLLIPVLAAVLAGLRAAARAPRGDRGERWYATGLVLAGLWLLAGVATQVNVSSAAAGSFLGLRGSGEINGRGGLGLPSLVTCAFAFGVLAWAVQRFAAPTVADAFPRAFVRLGAARGGRVDESWGTPDLAHDPGPARRRVLGGVAALVAVIGLVAGAAVARSVLYSPDRAARQYLHALARGDAGDALAVAQRPSPAGANLLTPAALARQVEAGRMTDVHVENVEVDGGEALARYRFTIGGRPEYGRLTLRRDGGWLRPRWRVVTPAGRVTVAAPAGVPSVEINGQQVPVEGGEAQATVFPGMVVARLPETGHLTSAAQQEMLGAPGDELTIRLEAELTETALAAIRDAVDEAVGECVGAGQIEPPAGCPFDGPFVLADEVSNVRWRINTPASQSLRVQLDPETGRISVDGQVDLVVTYRATDFFGTQTEEDTVTDHFVGVVTFAGTQPTVSFDASLF